MVCFLREDVASLFVQDEATQRILVATIPYMCLCTITDSAQGLLSGTIRALGIQGKAAVFVLLSYYLLALPLSFYLTFTLNLSISGIWLGTFIGTTVQSLGFIYLITKADWKEIADISK